MIIYNIQNYIKVSSPDGYYRARANLIITRKWLGFVISQKTKEIYKRTYSYDWRYRDDGSILSHSLQKLIKELIKAFEEYQEPLSE